MIVCPNIQTSFKWNKFQSYIKILHSYSSATCYYSNPRGHFETCTISLHQIGLGLNFPEICLSLSGSLNIFNKDHHSLWCLQTICNDEDLIIKTKCVMKPVVCGYWTSSAGTVSWNVFYTNIDPCECLLNCFVTVCLHVCEREIRDCWLSCCGSRGQQSEIITSVKASVQTQEP